MSATTEAVASGSRKHRPAAATPLRIRLRVLLHRGRLDRELAAGADPNATALRRERARKLLGERMRREIAASLERLLADAECSPAPFSSRVPIARNAIRDSRCDLEDVVRRLKEPAYISPQGVAMLNLLLSDGTSPFFTPDPSPRRLRWSLAAVATAIDHGPVMVTA
jgi:hypothetical protein